jgi:hypothetical protein
MKVPIRLLTATFSRVFQTSKEATRELRPQLVSAVQGVSKIGSKKLKEFFLSLPIFIVFFRELLRQRSQVQAQKQLFIIGAAATLSTLGLVILTGVMSSLPVQLLLVITHPYIGIPLLVSGGMIIATVTVLLVWLIIYVLNIVMQDDPVYQQIREKFLPSSTQEILAEVQAEIESSGADLEKLRKVVEENLKERGSKANAKKLEKDLQKLEKRFRSKATDRLSKAVKKADLEASSRTKA